MLLRILSMFFTIALLSSCKQGHPKTFAVPFPSQLQKKLGMKGFNKALILDSIHYVNIPIEKNKNSNFQIPLKQLDISHSFPIHLSSDQAQLLLSLIKKDLSNEKPKLLHKCIFSPDIGFDFYVENNVVGKLLLSTSCQEWWFYFDESIFFREYSDNQITWNEYIKKNCN